MGICSVISLYKFLYYFQLTNMKYDEEIDVRSPRKFWVKGMIFLYEVGLSLNIKMAV